MPEAYVLKTLRTARTQASPRGGFAGISPMDLLVTLQGELLTRTGLDPDVIIGCASQNASTATMLAGWDGVPGVTINRFCAAGIDAVARLRGHDPELAVAGGVERVPGADVLRRRPAVLPCPSSSSPRRSPRCACASGRYGVAAVSGAAGLGAAVLVERVAS